MAIIPSLPGLIAVIKVNGAIAEEYENPNGEEKPPMTRDDFDLPATHGEALPYIVKYIEAKPSAPYEFHVTKMSHFRGRGHHIASQVSRDGRSLTLRHEPDDILSGQPQPWISIDKGYYSGNPTSGYETHFFQFAAFNIVETDRLTSEALDRQMSVAQRCGTLKVSLFNMQKSGIDNSPVTGTKQLQHHPHAADLAEEAAKGKAVDCFTAYTTKPMVGTPSKRPIGKYTDGKKRPFAVFEFRYRTREGLMREGAIPRPSIAEQVEGMSNDEIRQRLTQVMEANERSATVSPGPKDTRRIKREAEEEICDDEFMARYKARRLDNVRLEVDLSDD
ncbi:hypothetical protein C8A01DRAFT_37033 [Parachaetomium inaequale]|uniref:DUF7918 domain-containing protein n=1 Tax=Parachaetomium inaequale TaxID=2588326 RepID=A0AAN6PF71_9PEZI|nr:hypothetical protein C8A01DRAFT_37033 [Parachaetomium inaequale]